MSKKRKFSIVLLQFMNSFSSEIASNILLLEIGDAILLENGNTIALEA